MAKRGRSGSLHDRAQRHDAFFHKARREGYAARSVYKLEDIDRQLGLLCPNDRILDLGCYPGSWLRYARAATGPYGTVVGVDRQPLKTAVPKTLVLVGDIFTLSDEELLGALPAFDVVLSDMAPDTTGIRMADQARSAALLAEALGRAERLLAPGGRFVGKIFQSEEIAPLRRRMEKRFSEVRLLKPEASRMSSPEVYLAGKGFA
jgi:23S rRNA (uridine2552-2'-O)-methyltransferase